MTAADRAAHRYALKTMAVIAVIALFTGALFTIVLQGLFG